MVLHKQTIEQLEAGTRRHGPANPDLRLVVADLWIEVVPAAGVEHGVVDLLVQLSQPRNLWVGDAGIVDLVIEPRKAK